MRSSQDIKSHAVRKAAQGCNEFAARLNVIDSYLGELVAELKQYGSVNIPRIGKLTAVEDDGEVIIRFKAKPQLRSEINER